MYRYGTTILLGICFLSPVHAQQRGTLSEVTKQLAETALKTAEKRNQFSISLGHFVPVGVNENSGAGIAAELAKHLGKKAETKATLELAGKYMFLDDPENPKMKVIRIKATLTDRKNGDETDLPDSTFYVSSPTDQARIGGANTRFKSDEEYGKNARDEADKEKRITEGRKQDVYDSLPPERNQPPKHKAHVHGAKNTYVSPTDDSPYYVEIRTKPLNSSEAAQPRRITLDDPSCPGLPFVDIEKGHVYEIHVYNRASHKIGVFLHVDGIDQFTFSTVRKPDGTPKYRAWVGGEGSWNAPHTIAIKGWHYDNTTLQSFLVTEYGKGAVSQFPSKAQGNRGMICVSICKAVPAGTGTRSSGSETGFGPPIEQRQKEVQMDLLPIEAVITIRYSR